MRERARKMEKRNRAWGRELGNSEGEGKKFNVTRRTVPCFSVCGIFLVNIAKFIDITREGMDLGR